MSELAALVSAALAELKASHSAQERAISRLEVTLQHALKQGVEHLPVSDAPPSEHRRAHRPGLQRRIDADPELETFVRARVDRMTFTALAAEVADTFPPNRRVGRSAIHDWWKRHNKTQPATVSRKYR